MIEAYDAREYDPRTARWLQRDPIDAASGDPNLYRYCGNDPINRGDLGGSQYAPKQPANQRSAEQQSKAKLGKIPPQRPVQENDPRFPKPAPYPSCSSLIQANPNSEIEFWIARNILTIRRLRDEAYRLTEKHFAGVFGTRAGGPGDAFRHCVWACLVQKELGNYGYQHVVIDHENDTAPWAEGKWDKTYSPMDLANDAVGKQCAARKGKSCEEACLEALKRGELYVLPRKFWQ
ncbi:MAG: RHS repeat-associated core domain-containing protein [Thermofilaceae archaeon]